MGMLYSTQVTIYERGYTCKEWEKYGLSVKFERPISEFREHNLVTNWLDSHPEDAEKYLQKISGYRYLDILSKAERAAA